MDTKYQESLVIASSIETRVDTRCILRVQGTDAEMCGPA